jgi:uncharacterized protein (UPF0332 family)
MPDPEPAAYLLKAHQNLTVADLTLQAGHYDACCSRAYYAAFQAAVAALWAEGIRPPRESDRTLSHKAVQGEWAGRLVYQRKLYAAELRSVLNLLYDLRLDADYAAAPVREREARGATLRARQLVAAVDQRLRSSGE